MNAHESQNEPEFLSDEQAPPAGELLLGQLTALDHQQATVNFQLHGKTHTAQALYTTALTQAHVGRQVVLSFVQGDMRQPLVLGVVHNALFEMLENFEMSAVAEQADAQNTQAVEPESQTVLVDGKTVTVQAEQQLQLKCGESSITLTRDGKIQIRGKYLVNRASGVNRIIGGSVQVN